MATVVFEGKDTERRPVVVTREASNDPAHPGHYTLIHDGAVVAETDAEYLGRPFDVTGFMRSGGVRLPKTHEPLAHIGD